MLEIFRSCLIFLNSGCLGEYKILCDLGCTWTSITSCHIWFASL